MKKMITAAVAALALVFSLSSFAATNNRVGVVDMQQIFQSAPQVKQINKDLMQQFAGQKQQIITQGKALQASIQQFEKNKAVMSATDAANAKQKITQQEVQLRQAQAKFQQALFAAQNQAMSKFMKKVRGIIGTISAQNNLDIVLPKNTVLYSAEGRDITQQVISKLQ